MAKVGLITSNWSGNLIIGVTRGLTYLAQSQDELHIGKWQGCFYCFKNRADSLELDSLHINTWGESNPTYKFLPSETRTTLHRNWVPFILSINLPSRQIRLLLRSSRNSATCDHFILLTSLWSQKLNADNQGGFLFSLWQRWDWGKEDALHINQRKIRTGEQIPAYKLRPKRLTSIYFQFKIICKKCTVKY